jgi:RNA polymerase sigma-70 factor (ECF subfamily)
VAPHPSKQGRRANWCNLRFPVGTMGITFAVTDVGNVADGALVSSLVLSDDAAFAELFRRHARSITASARLILGNSTLCDDVVAEVFLALWLAPQAFDPSRGSLLGYLRVKARGKSIDLLRSETARVRREVAARPNRRQTPSLDSDMMADESSIEVLEALASLPAREREPIELAFQQGMTYRQIAAYLGVPEGTIKSRIRSGLRHLREDIEKQRVSGEAPRTSSLAVDEASA